MSKVRVRVLPPAEIDREGDVAVSTHGEFAYAPRFLRDAARRTGGTHKGPVVAVDIIDEAGGVERVVQAVTVGVDDDGAIRLHQQQIVQPSFLKEGR
jgi:hypothetical protein